jgi:hypothetical protein
VLDVSGALDFLKACGFEVHADAADSLQPGTWAYFLDDAQLSHVESGLSQLQLAMQSAQQQHSQQQQTDRQPLGQAQAQPTAQGVAAAGPGSSGLVAMAETTQTAATPAAAAGAQVPLVPRNTLVLLPAAPDADVPEWFFERTAAEVKSEFMSLLRQRQANQVVASKAWKDLKLGGSSSSSSSKQPRVITLRVRFPEVCHGGFIHCSNRPPTGSCVLRVWHMMMKHLLEHCVTFLQSEPRMPATYACRLPDSGIALACCLNSLQQTTVSNSTVCLPACLPLLLLPAGCVPAGLLWCV